MQSFVMKLPGSLLVRSGWNEEITWALALTLVISLLMIKWNFTNTKNSKYLFLKNPTKMALLCKSSIQ